MHYTGQERDSESNLDNFGARYYSSQQGRFMSPDPAGLLAVDPTNPQSWNLYSYVYNNPLSMVDPTGTDACYWDDGTNDDDPADGGATQGECNDQGGTWIPTLNQTITVTADEPNWLDTLDSDFTGGLQWLSDFGNAFASGPSLTQVSKNLNRCAAANANSAKNLLGITSNGFFANAFFGNDFSSLSNLAFGPNRAAAAGSLATSNPTPANLTYQVGSAIANGVGVTTTTTTSATISTPAYDITASVTQSSTSSLGQTAIGQVLGKAADIFSSAKLGFDAAAYLYAEGACAIR